jgi:hypothetical protein
MTCPLIWQRAAAEVFYIAALLQNLTTVAWVLPHSSSYSPKFAALLGRESDDDNLKTETRCSIRSYLRRCSGRHRLLTRRLQRAAVVAQTPTWTLQKVLSISLSIKPRCDGTYIGASRSFCILALPLLRKKPAVPYITTFAVKPSNKSPHRLHPMSSPADSRRDVQGLQRRHELCHPPLRSLCFVRRTEEAVAAREGREEAAAV